MDKYDNMLLKARAEMLGQEPLRKAPPHDALFSHVWEHVIKAPADDPYGLMQGYQDERNQQRQQQVQERTQSSPAPADPFGQMNEGASLDGPTQGMGANFRQGRSETRDPNKTGMFGRAKQFMNRFRRQPSQQTESTPPSLQEEQAPPADERAFRDTPRAELPPSFQSWNRYDRDKDPFPTREWVRDTMDAGGNDLAEWDRMNALREQREAETQQTQQAEQGNDLRAATRAKMTEPPMPSPMQEAQQMKTPVDAGLDAMREPAVDDDFYNRFAGIEEQQGELPPDFNTEIEPQQMLMTDPPYEGGQEEMTEENPTDWQDKYLTPETTDEEEWKVWDALNEEEYLSSASDADFEQINEQEEPARATTQTGTKIPRKALPAPAVAPENRQLPESTGENKPGEMAGIPSKPRTGFNEVNNRSEDDKGRQAPGARSDSGRLKEKKRRDADVERRSVDPTEATEKVLNPPKPKKASKKKAAKKGPAAKAVKATASKRKAKAEKPLEGTEEMREEAPPKKKTGTKAKRGKKPVQEDIEGAQVMEEKAPPKKGAKKVKETTSKAKPKKGSALATVNEVAEQRKKGADPSKNIFANKAKPARARKKNPKKEAVKGLGEAAERSRTRQAAKAKKNEPSEESKPEKEYGLSISGSASRSEIDEIMEAARNGNKSAQSAIYNNAGTLEDSHGISQEEIDEASGR